MRPHPCYLMNLVGQREQPAQFDRSPQLTPMIKAARIAAPSSERTPGPAWPSPGGRRRRPPRCHPGGPDRDRCVPLTVMADWSVSRRLRRVVCGRPARRIGGMRLRRPSRAYGPGSSVRSGWPRTRCGTSRRGIRLLASRLSACHGLAADPAGIAAAALCHCRRGTRHQQRCHTENPHSLCHGRLCHQNCSLGRSAAPQQRRTWWWSHGISAVSAPRADLASWVTGYRLSDFLQYVASDLSSDRVMFAGASISREPKLLANASSYFCPAWRPILPAALRVPHLPARGAGPSLSAAHKTGIRLCDNYHVRSASAPGKWLSVQHVESASRALLGGV
jgi:hypothetical protein